jgi:predicted RNA-binding Zn ribbon-like protein
MSEPRPAPFFIADATALDFLNTVATPVDITFDWLDSGDDLIEWLQTSELVPGEILNSMRRSTLPGELDAVAAQARSLREWFRGFVRQHKGKRLRPEALRELAPLNRILERDQEFGQIVKRERGQDGATGSGLTWRPARRWQTPDSLLLPIAKSMAELVSNDDFTHVKACEGAACTLLFLDRTHGRGRRWCSMAMCGNRAKQAAHRKRERRNNE